MTHTYEELEKDRSKDVERQSGKWSWFNSQLYYVTLTEFCMRLVTHIQVGIHFVISYMQSNLWRISPGGCFQKAGSAFPGFTRFIFGWIRVDHIARFLCCYFFVLSIFLLCRMCPMLPPPLDLLFLIASSIYSNVYSPWLKHHALHVEMIL